MPIEFDCPACGQRVSAPDTARDTYGPCPYCRTPITAPAVPGDGDSSGVGRGGAGRRGQFPETGRGLLAPPSGQLDLGAVLTESWNVMKANAGLLIGSSTVTLLILGLVYATLFFTMAGSLVASGRWPLPTEPPPGFKVAIQIANLVLLPLYWGPLYVTHELMTRKL